VVDSYWRALVVDQNIYCATLLHRATKERSSHLSMRIPQRRSFLVFGAAFAAPLLLLTTAAAMMRVVVDAYSPQQRMWHNNGSGGNNYRDLSQKSVVRRTLENSGGNGLLSMSTTRREPIRMPSQTPMVPYMVRTEMRTDKRWTETPIDGRFVCLEDSDVLIILIFSILCNSYASVKLLKSKCDSFI